MTRPSVTVVVPCHNYGRYLRDVVASLRQQRGVEVDVIVVDDASTDGSADIVREVAATSRSVAAVLHDTNAGHIATYNDGLRRATGTYVVLLSADDLLPPDAITRSVALMEAHPSVGFVYGYAQSFTNSPPSEVGAVRNWSVWPGHTWLQKSVQAGRCFVVSPEVVMRRSAFKEIGGYDERLPHSADFHMWLRTAVGWDVGRVNGPTQAWYRVHTSNMHLTTYAGWLTDLVARRETFDIFFAENISSAPELAALHGRAKAALAREALRLAIREYGSSDASTVAAYIDFARHTHPAVEGTMLWQLCRSGPLAQRSLPLRSVRRQAHRVQHHLLWRRERRFGF